VTALSTPVRFEYLIQPTVRESEHSLNMLLFSVFLLAPHFVKIRQ
jgi:hypothetical protein